MSDVYLTIDAHSANQARRRVGRSPRGKYHHAWKSAGGRLHTSCSGIGVADVSATDEGAVELERRCLANGCMQRWAELS